MNTKSHKLSEANSRILTKKININESYNNVKYKMMSKKYSLIVIITASIFLLSCAGQESQSNDMSSTFAAATKTEAYAESSEFEPIDGKATPPTEKDIPALAMQNIERKLIKEGSITFETSDCKSTKELIHQTANNLNGYLSKDDEYTYESRIQHSVTVRIPSQNFDKLLTDISKSIKVLDDQNITVKDVTEEFVDVEARLKAKKIVEQRYLDLLSKANSVGDILQVENELARLREQIESTEGRLRYLKDQVSLSTLTITYYQSTESGFRFSEKAKNGLSNGYKGLLWFFIGIINIWPFILFIGLSVWLIVRLIKKSRNKKIN